MDIYKYSRALKLTLYRVIKGKIRTVNRYPHLKNAKRRGYSIEKKDRIINLRRNNISFGLRIGSSDFAVFEQIFLNEEYQSAVKVLIDNETPVKTIIDLGANIGLSSLYFKEHFPDARILCVEPDSGNYQQLERHLSEVPHTSLYRKAIWPERKTLFLNTSFRDSKEWSIAVSTSQEGSYDEVDTITIDELISGNNIKTIDLLKIDIEGAEATVFADTDTCYFLKSTKVVVIETHEETGSRNIVVEALQKNGFVFFEDKQSLIAINTFLVDQIKPFANSIQ